MDEGWGMWEEVEGDKDGVSGSDDNRHRLKTNGPSYSLHLLDPPIVCSIRSRQAEKALYRRLL